MLPFPESKKRKRQALTVEQKKWICERKKTEPAITHKNIALLFFEIYKVRTLLNQAVRTRLINRTLNRTLIDIEDEDETLKLVALDDEPILIENETKMSGDSIRFEK